MTANMSTLMDDMAERRVARPGGHTSHRVTAPPIAKAEQKIDHRQGHAVIHKHLKNAIAAGDTQEKRGHVFRALSAINAMGRTPRAAAPPVEEAAEPMEAPQAPPAPTHGRPGGGGGLMHMLQSLNHR